MLNGEIRPTRKTGFSALGVIGQPHNLELLLGRVKARHVKAAPGVPGARRIDCRVGAAVQRVIAQAAHQFVAQIATGDGVIASIARQVVL